MYEINLIEGEIWEDINNNTIEIIECYDDFEIVEVKLSNSLQTREYPMKIITENIKTNDFKRIKKK